MTVRNSLWVSHAGGIDTVEDARLGVAALVAPATSGLKVKSGFKPNGGDPGAVTATGTPDKFVHVAPFQLTLQSNRSTAGGAYLCSVDAIVDLDLLTSNPANPTNPRNDLIIAQQSDEFYGDGTNTFVVKQVVGTPAASPLDPTVTGSPDWVPLARVRVNANATTITSGNITDLRSSGHASSIVGGKYSAAQGGVLPVQSQAERDALVNIYDGMPVWRQDLDALEIWNASAYVSAGLGSWYDFSSAAIISAASGGFAKGTLTTYSARYMIVGHTVLYTGMVTINTGGGFATGTGTWNLLLPVAAQASLLGAGSLLINDSGTSLYGGGVYVFDSTHLHMIRNASGADLDATGPGTAWATNDWFRWTITYEAA